MQEQNTTTDKNQTPLPKLFADLIALGCLSAAEIHATSDGFWAATATIAEILACRGITSVPGSKGDRLDCELFFADWYLYAVADGTNFTYSLFKMREQEYDVTQGYRADGDTPGVTIPFISMQAKILRDALQAPTPQNTGRLGEEINRVVASAGQHHSKTLKQYFVRTSAQGPYLIAALYTSYLASLAENGSLPVPERYACAYQKSGTRGRVPRFIEENNRLAGAVICDHEKICVGDPLCPTEPERLALLATHTGNTSFFSFAAEVQFHARFLTRWAKIPIPFIGGSPYASAIRADMSIGDTEFAGPTPYYRPNSRIVKKQYRCHQNQPAEPQIRNKTL